MIKILMKAKRIIRIKLIKKLNQLNHQRYL
jgi:hypothetical protein